MKSHILSTLVFGVATLGLVSADSSTTTTTTSTSTTTSLPINLPGSPSVTPPVSPSDLPSCILDCYNQFAYGDDCQILKDVKFTCFCQENILADGVQKCQKCSPADIQAAAAIQTAFCNAVSSPPSAIASETSIVKSATSSSASTVAAVASLTASSTATTSSNAARPAAFTMSINGGMLGVGIAFVGVIAGAVLVL